VAWQPVGGMERWETAQVLKQWECFVKNQQWTCRYCGLVNVGGVKCTGKYAGTVPTGGPGKAGNNALAEYAYFLSKSQSAPSVCPTDRSGWFDEVAIKQWRAPLRDNPIPCMAQRCVHFSHVNQSDQVLAFPRSVWNGPVGPITNSARHYLPGAMLGHQTVGDSCPKCKNGLDTVAYDEHVHPMMHSWWVMEALYWFKVDIHNKKMLHLNRDSSDERYAFLKRSVDALFEADIGDFVYTCRDGFTQSIPFKSVLIRMKQWLDDPANYLRRFTKSTVA